MSETTDKINKLATQHKVIGVKTDCPHFSTIGNLCSRVENGMMRCDEYLECEFKYIDTLKEENEQLQKRFNDYQDKKIEENANLMKRLDIADKKLTVLSRELEQSNKENENLRKINHELAEEHKTIGQDLYAEIKNYRKEKENLKEENARLKKIKDDFFKQAEISHQAVQDKNKIIEKLETVIQEIKQLVSTNYIKNKKQLVQNYDCLDNFMQKIEDKCNEVQQ